jgi:hypothetical protein
MGKHLSRLSGNTNNAPYEHPGVAHCTNSLRLCQVIRDIIPQYLVNSSASSIFRISGIVNVDEQAEHETSVALSDIRAEIILRKHYQLD